MPGKGCWSPSGSGRGWNSSHSQQTIFDSRYTRPRNDTNKRRQQKNEEEEEEEEEEKKKEEEKEKKKGGEDVAYK